jgi:hypothetical protein
MQQNDRIISHALQAQGNIFIVLLIHGRSNVGATDSHMQTCAMSPLDLTLRDFIHFNY